MGVLSVSVNWVFYQCSTHLRLNRYEEETRPLLLGPTFHWTHRSSFVVIRSSIPLEQLRRTFATNLANLHTAIDIAAEVAGEWSNYNDITLANLLTFDTIIDYL